MYGTALVVTVVVTAYLVFETDQSSIETDSIEYSPEQTFTQKIEQRAAAVAPTAAAVASTGQSVSRRTIKKKNRKNVINNRSAW